MWPGIDTTCKDAKADGLTFCNKCANRLAVLSISQGQIGLEFSHVYMSLIAYALASAKACSHSLQTGINSSTALQACRSAMVLHSRLLPSPRSGSSATRTILAASSVHSCLNLHVTTRALVSSSIEPL